MSVSCTGNAKYQPLLTCSQVRSSLHKILRHGHGCSQHTGQWAPCSQPNPPTRTSNTCPQLGRRALFSSCPTNQAATADQQLDFQQAKPTSATCQAHWPYPSPTNIPATAQFPWPSLWPLRTSAGSSAHWPWHGCVPLWCPKVSPLTPAGATGSWVHRPHPVQADVKDANGESHTER